MVGGGSAQQSQAGMEQRFHQQAGKGTLASIGSKNQQGANDTVRESVIGAVDVGLYGSHRRFRSAGMLSQTDPYVLGAKQESEHLHATRPCRFVPCVVRNKDRLAPGRPYGARSTTLCNLHHMMSRKWKVKPGEMRDVSQKWRRDGVLGKVHSANPSATKKVAKLSANNLRGTALRCNRLRRLRAHGMLR